eukprot:Hpha_TRINITY_DN8220_c0_g2::TRINITY_DN8220_c0_g2_i2::g.111882::m.111882
MPLYVNPWSEGNLAHFIGDLWHLFFQVNDLYREKLGEDLPMIFFPQNNTRRLEAFPRLAGLPPDLMNKAVPGLIASGRLGKGRTCVRELFVDCPTPNVLSRYDRFQAHLSKHYKWSFEPRTAPPSGETHPQMLLLARRPAGSRVLRNPQGIMDTAKAVGWCGDILRSDQAKQSEICKVLQRADLLVAVHGAELAAMVFMRQGSIVVEGVPDAYADHDGFYAEQARAGKITLLRWHIDDDRIRYWGKQKRCKNKAIREKCKRCMVPWKKKDGVNDRNTTLWPIFRLRATRSLLKFNILPWDAIARLAYKLLPYDAPDTPCPREPPSVELLTGLPEVSSNKLRRFSRAALCGDDFIYPCAICTGRRKKKKSFSMAEILSSQKEVRAERRINYALDDKLEKLAEKEEEKEDEKHEDKE